MPINHNKNELKSKIAQKLNIKPNEIINFKINKQSIDARDKNNLMYIYEIDANIKSEKHLLNKHSKDILKTPDETYKLPQNGIKTLNHQIIIVGSGPAGLFAGYMLSKAGFKPSDIAVLLHHPVQTITTMRRRLAEKLSLAEKTTPAHWDNLINSL